MAEKRTIPNFHLKVSTLPSSGLLSVEFVDDAPKRGRGFVPFDVESPLKQAYKSKEALGRALYDCLFCDPKVRQKFEDCRQERCAGKSGDRVGLRLVLDIWSSPDRVEPLLNLPWELLHDGRDWLALDPTLSITRRLNIKRRDVQEQEEIRPLLRALLTCAEPGDKKLRFNGERALKAVHEVMESVIKRLTLRELPHATKGELEPLIRQGFDIVHFLGHGDVEAEKAQMGLLFLELEESPSLDILTATELRRWIEEAAECPRLFVLTACHSGNPTGFGFLGVATALLDAGVEAVVAMQTTFYSNEAEVFAKAFYKALGDYLMVDDAMQKGRRELHLAQSELELKSIVRLLIISEERQNAPTVQWYTGPLGEFERPANAKSVITFPGWAVPTLFLQGDGWLGQGPPEPLIIWPKDQKEMVYIEEEDFYIDKYPVTCGEYREFVQKRGILWQNPWQDKYEGEDVNVDALPATGMTLGEALEYARWAGKHIPTPTEWRQAALSGYSDKEALFPWGYRFLGNLCNTKESGYLKPREVDWSSGQQAYDERGKMLSNSSSAGMCDIVGNVAEWTQTKDRQSVLCGGSFEEPSKHCTVQTMRLISQCNFKNRAVGFRCAASWPEFVEQQYHDTQ